MSRRSGSNVFDFPGAARADEAKDCADEVAVNMVDEFARLAAAANSGELRAVGLVEIHSDGGIHTRTLGRLKHKHQLMAGAGYLAHDLAQAGLDDSD